MAKNNLSKMLELPIKKYQELFESGKVDTTVSYQRTEEEKGKWNKPEHINGVFSSIEKGEGFGVICVNYITARSVYEVIDGGHRTRFVNKAFKGMISYEGIKIEDMPDSSWFFEHEIKLEVFTDLDDLQCRAIFENRNGGAALSAYETRKGRLLWLITLPEFQTAAKNLLGILTTETKTPKREVPEEILCQALSGFCGNRDYSGGGFVGYLTDNKESATKNLSVFAANVNEFCANIVADSEKECKKSLKKTFLNVLFAAKVLPEFSAMSKFFASEEMQDQIDLKTASGAGSAAVAKVEKRIAVIEKIANKTYTFKAKPERVSAKKSTEKTTEKTTIPAVVKTESKNLDSWYSCYGKGVAVVCDGKNLVIDGGMIESVLNHLDKIHAKDVKPRNDSGKLNVSFIDAKGAKHTKPFVELYNLSKKSDSEFARMQA